MRIQLTFIGLPGLLYRIPRKIPETKHVRYVLLALRPARGEDQGEGL